MLECLIHTSSRSVNLTMEVWGKRKYVIFLCQQDNVLSADSYTEMVNTNMGSLKHLQSLLHFFLINVK